MTQSRRICSKLTHDAECRIYSNKRSPLSRAAHNSKISAAVPQTIALLTYPNAALILKDFRHYRTTLLRYGRKKKE